MKRTNFGAAVLAVLALSTLAPAATPTDPPVKGGGAPAAPAQAGTEPSPAIAREAENAVVKVFSTVRYPDFSRPWTKQTPSEITGSGVVVEGRRILTNAHVVLYASQIQVQGSQAGDKKPATVVAIAPGIDLALLKLEDDHFFDARPPLPRASALPEIKDAVLAYGFPAGGNSLSITKGIVSRIEFVAYSLSASGLRIQIDAAINPGNSGGPAVAGDRMIGLAFSRLGGAQNIGYIIPNEEIELFLADIADGHYDGKPGLYDELQTLESPALRHFLKLPDSVQGVVVHQPFETGASYPLKEWDVITHIAGTPVDDQGMVRLGNNLRVSFRYLIQKSAANGRLPLTMVRGGHAQQVELPVRNSRAMLIPELKGEYPAYFIYGPLVFSPASQQFAQALGSNPDMVTALSFLKSPLLTLRGEPPQPDREELVVVSSPLFPHRISQGYSNPAGGVLHTVNGTRIRSLRHLVAVLRDLRDEFVTFEFDHRGGEALVFERREIDASTEAILTDNEVRAQGSADMLKIWNERTH